MKSDESELECEEYAEYKVETDDCVVVCSEQNVFKTHLSVTKKLCVLLTSKKSQQLVTKVTKEDETNISVDADAELVEISGGIRERVIESRMKLTKIVLSIRQQLPFTHLITVPFNCAQMRSQFNVFKSVVMTQLSNTSIDEHLFQNENKLHLTVCVLTLVSDEEVKRAQRVFRECCQSVTNDILNNESLRVAVKSLDVMNNNPSKAHILFAKIDEQSNRLQSIANRLVECFVNANLLSESTEETVKLHITLMNSLYRQRNLNKANKASKETQFKSKRVKREPFNAKQIIERYNDYLFADLVVPNIQLNNIRTKSDSGFYGLIEMFELPKESDNISINQ